MYQCLTNADCCPGFTCNLGSPPAQCDTLDGGCAGYGCCQ
jgi:hypothetical protein